MSIFILILLLLIIYDMIASILNFAQKPPEERTKILFRLFKWGIVLSISNTIYIWCFGTYHIVQSWHEFLYFFKNKEFAYVVLSILSSFGAYEIIIETFKGVSKILSKNYNRKWHDRMKGISMIWFLRTLHKEIFPKIVTILKYIRFIKTENGKISPSGIIITFREYLNKNDNERKDIEKTLFDISVLFIYLSVFFLNYIPNQLGNWLFFLFMIAAILFLLFAHSFRLLDINKEYFNSNINILEKLIYWRNEYN